jgi:type VI secretion system FHA domain protein
MILTLEITGPQAAKLGPAARKVFRSAGGTIGRLPDNHWALPDPYVSSRHALVRYQDGVFYIEDTSTNGVFINSPDKRLAKGQPHALQSGDWIFIEPYEIRASITNDVQQAAPASPFNDLFAPAPSVQRGRDPLSFDDPFGEESAPPLRQIPSSSEPFGARELIPEGENVDPLALLDLEPSSAPPRPNVPRAADLASGSVLSDPYRPPPTPSAPAPALPPQSAGGLIPDDWLNPDDRSHAPSSPPPAQPRPAAQPPVGPIHDGPPPRRPSAAAVPKPAPYVAPPARVSPPAPPPSSGAGEIDLAEMLAGAGLDPTAITPELTRTFGRILRVVVAGVMDALQARKTIKSEFRMGMTTFKPADNNPLKFSANVDDALHNLLVKRNAAYLPPVEAFEDAFDDVRNHQMAMLEGVRVAFQAMLGAFDPDSLQEEFDRQLKKGALLSVPAKLRYWDLYREKIHDMVKDPETSFRELFGDEFANAYEEQLKRLKAQGRKP